MIQRLILKMSTHNVPLNHRRCYRFQTNGLTTNVNSPPIVSVPEKVPQDDAPMLHEDKQIKLNECSLINDVTGISGNETTYTEKKSVIETINKQSTTVKPEEYGFFYKGPEPTRYGDWAHGGRVTDF